MHTHCVVDRLVVVSHEIRLGSTVVARSLAPQWLPSAGAVASARLHLCMLVVSSMLGAPMCSRVISGETVNVFRLVSFQVRATFLYSWLHRCMRFVCESECVLCVCCDRCSGTFVRESPGCAELRRLPFFHQPGGSRRRLLHVPVEMGHSSEADHRASHGDGLAERRC